MDLWRSLFIMQLGVLISLSAAEDINPPIEVGCLDPYEVYRLKRTCYNNCYNLNSTTEACVTPSFYGCDCIDGYVYESATSNVCVPVSSCNVKCPPKMHFDPCITSYRKNCSTIFQESSPTPGCLPRCVCNFGYILSDDPALGCIGSLRCFNGPAEADVNKVVS